MRRDLAALLAALALLVGGAACEDDDSGDDDATDDDDDATIAAHVIAAQVTWTLDFDTAAEEAGWSDCQYARTYEGVRFNDQPYLCPACALQFAGTAEMTTGFGDCYEPLFGGTQTRTEYWGVRWSLTDGDDGALHRGATENHPIGELTTIDAITLDIPFQVSWDSAYSLADFGLPDAGEVALSAAGEATISLEESVRLPDLEPPRTDPYACGWPLGNPGTLSTDYVLALDATFPRAWLEDACGELVDVWDFHGSYLVVDSTQPDCGYCLQMAQGAPDFLAEMADAGVPTEFLSVLGEGLSNIIGEPDQADFEDYIDTYGHGGPILKDRGFGYAIFEPYWGDDLGYPTWAVVRPDMSVLEVGIGFSSWDEIRDIILADAA